MAKKQKRPISTTKPTTNIEDQYPNVAKWVRSCGWIEVGETDWQGFQVKALDAGGMICENAKCGSLAEAMKYLEKALGTWFAEQGR